MGLFKIHLGQKSAYILVLLASFLNMANLAADSMIINNLNVIDRYQAYFDLNADLLGLNVSLISVGAVVASPVVGMIADRLGRIRGMIIGAAISCIAIIIASTATTEAQFAVGRLLLGSGIFISSMIAPLLTMEVAHPKRRSILFSCIVGLMVMTGVVYSAVVIGIFQFDTDWTWRGLILGELITPLASIVLLLFCPESPRWLVYKGRIDEALDVLAMVHGHGNKDDPMVQLEIKEIHDTLQYEKEHEQNWRSLISPKPNLRRFLICILVAIFYQMSGANNLLYFMTILIGRAGITDLTTVLVINMCVGIWNALCSVSGSILIDRFGRKMTFVSGTSLMSLCLIIVAVLQKVLETKTNAGITAGGIIAIFFFQLPAMACWQVLGYQYPTEVLKFSQRAKGLAVSQALGYAFSFLYTYTFPIALENISWRYFLINGCWDIGIVAAVWFCFPETKGKTLEEIDEIFDGVVHLSDSQGVVTGLELKDSKPLKLTSETVASADRNETSGDKKGGLQQ